MTMPQKNFPKVSVILTSYNHAAYIATAIESVLAQTLTDWELLIVDDGSTDNSRDIIRNFDDPRIKFFLHEQNRGPRLAVTDAIKSARGKYIAVHHSDDAWHPDKLAKQVAKLDADENFAACFTWVEFIDERGEPVTFADNDAYEKIFEQENRSRAQWLNHFFYKANCLCHPSAMLRRDAVEKFQLYESRGLWQLPDYLAWIRLCFRREIFVLPEKLTCFRLLRKRQENSSAVTFDNTVRENLEFYFVAREFADGFTDDKFFLEVFPTARKFLVDGQINRRFALARLCLEGKFIATSSFQLVALEILQDLLSDNTTAAQIKQLYDYDEKSFRLDSGSCDLFNLAWRIPVLHAEVFSGDGENFSRVAQRIIIIDAADRFYGRMDFDLDAPTKFLRFSPDTDFVSVKINRVLINGVEQKISGDNAGMNVDGFRRFFTTDPQIFFSAENLVGHVRFEVFGECERDYPQILSRLLATALTKNSGELVEENRQLSVQTEHLRAEVQRLQAIVDSVLNSNSWKLTKPLRALKNLLK